MKHVQRTVRLAAAVLLTALCLSSCGVSSADPPKTQTEVSDSAAQATEIASAAQTTARLSTETAPTEKKVTEKKEKEKEEEQPVQFMPGTWNDGVDTEYTFNTDGTGTITQVSKKTSESFRYEVNAKRGRITFYTGENDKKETVKYTLEDTTSMMLTYTGKKTVALTYGVIISKASAPFRMGTWKSDNVTFVFRADGSGEMQNLAGSVSFRYEINPDTCLLMMHLESADDVEAAVYMVRDETHMGLALDSGTVELTWTDSKTE